MCEYLNISDELYGVFTDEFKRSHKDEIIDTMIKINNIVDEYLNKDKANRQPKQVLSRTKTIEIILFHQSVLRDAIHRIERIRDQELATEMRILEQFVVDLKLIKYGVDDRDYHEAYFKHNL